MNPGIEYYRPHGEPAQAHVTVATMPTAGDSVTIASTTYTFGTHFGGSTVYEVAEGLAHVVNGDRAKSSLHAARTPIRAVYAVYYGNRVVLIAVSPGTTGNSYGLTTTNSTAFVVSGATFSGGTTGTVAAMAAASSAAVEALLTPTASLPLDDGLTNSSVTVPATFAVGVECRKLILFGYRGKTRVLNSSVVWIQPTDVDGAGGIPLVPGGSVTIDAPYKDFINTSTLFFDVTTAGDGVYALMFV